MTRSGRRGAKYEAELKARAKAEYEATEVGQAERIARLGRLGCKVLYCLKA